MRAGGNQERLPETTKSERIYSLAGGNRMAKSEKQKGLDRHSPVRAQVG